MSFVHLHIHSEYSWLDGACFIDDLVQKAVQYKMPAVAITDRNSLAGASRLWHQCIKAGIKPIIGLEMAVWNDEGDDRVFSVILLAKNGSGYDNLCRLVTLAYINDPNAPRITKSQLKDNAQNLICLSFSVVGELCTLLLEGKEAEARQVSDWYYEVFGEDYYYEIQNHNLPSEALAMYKLMNLAYETKIPVVLTNDCHYLERGDSISIDALNCIRKGIDFSHPDAKRFACNEYYFKTPKEMKSLFDFPRQLSKNTLEIANKINVTDGYIPIYDGDLSVQRVVDALRNYSTSMKIKSEPNSKHITVSLMDNKLNDVLEHLRKQLSDFNLMPFTKYESWTPLSIYSTVLKTMKVPKTKIKELCDLIPSGVNSLREAVLIDTDFSCLSSEDYVCRQSAEIADKLISTFREEKSAKQKYVLIPKRMSIPIVRDNDGSPRCQYDFNFINQICLISLEFT